MATNITEYNATAGSNTSIDSINLQENQMVASDVNNAIRSLMSHLKNVDTGTQALTALSVTGAVTGGSLVVDDITIDGSTISDAGDFTLDVGGDITLDADGGDVKINDGGTARMHIITSASETAFFNQTSDSDVKIKGVDGGSTITALTLDMSEAGQATFNSSIVVGGTVSLNSSNTSAFAQAGDNIFQLGTSTSDDFAFFTNNSESMRIDSGGNVLIGKNDNQFSIAGTQLYQNGEVNIVTGSGVVPLYINRLADAGNLIYFYQAGSQEGAISVSGSTVSYNGGHLSRWSQLADNTRDNTILKGTVMTNLDQMAEWTTDGVTEDNEQLNCMAVSSVEGDANVAGVFVNWDNDDDVYTNDMNVAMTGDMVIRIAKGTTVARGDLLMSAGDGTAKPQGDDIVRSKTIAKVTSTNVSHTYDDGTYLVPCVLMAC